MKKIIFDSGPIISLTTNNLLFILEELKKKSEIEFYITPAVRRELVEKPLSTKRFKFEALQVLRFINKGVIKVFEHDLLKEKTMECLDLANNIFSAQESLMAIVHYPDMESIVAAKLLEADAVVMDERTTRVLVESPAKLEALLESKLHTDVTINNEKLERFKNCTGDILVIRSFEIVTIAFEKGILDKYRPENIIDDASSNATLLESVLWGVKLNGCAVSEQEINTIIGIETKK
jgi:hypothetical protein